MQYTFNLAANATERYNIEGDYLKLIAATGTVQIETDYGRIDLLPGRGFRLPPGKKFAYFNVRDRTGAGNQGTLLAGSFDLIDDRVSGSVEVIDGGRARTLARQSFIASHAIPGSAGNQSQGGIFNPALSTARVVLKRIRMSSSAAQNLLLQTHSGTFLTLQPKALPKLINSGATPQSDRYSGNPAAVVGAAFSQCAVGASLTFDYVFDDPLVLLPGNGFSVCTQTVLTALLMDFEFYEEPNI